MPDWALAITIPNGERRVSEQMIRRDLPFHIFQRRLTLAHRGRLIQRLVPAFPRYVFIPFVTCWETVSSVSGFTGLVSFGNGPEKVDDKIVEEIKSICPGGILLEDEKKTSRFNFGDPVSVLENQFGTYHHHCGDGRAVILLNWMGRLVFVNVQECDLREVKRPPQLCKVRRRRRRRRRQRGTHQVQRCAGGAPS